MEKLGNVILSLVMGAFAVSIICSLTDRKTAMGGLIRLMGGLFLTFTVLSAVVDLDFSGITGFLEAYAVTGEDAAAMGEAMAEEEYRTIIKEKLEAYILDKARELGMNVTAEVVLEDDGIPGEVILRGSPSPYVKSKLEQFLREDLGITEENQRWIGP